MEWQIEERMPKYDDMREFDVWLRNGQVRRVRRVGNRSAYYSPGVLIFTDCTRPEQNAWCDEGEVIGWRHSGRDAPPLPRHPQVTFNLASALIGYDPVAHAAAYPGY